MVQYSNHIIFFINQKAYVTEQLCVNFRDAGTADWKADFKRNLPECVDAFEPCFIIFRIGSPTEWLLITFADDRAPIREKMLIASTGATFKSEFGQCNIKHEYHATSKKDLTLDAFERWLKSCSEPAPLTEVEKELETAYREQKSLNASAVAAQTLKGVLFPIDGNAVEALRNLADRVVNYVQLSVDTLNEAIKLEKSDRDVPCERLAEVMPRDKPRYHFYRFNHTYQDRPFETIVFVYTMPSSGCTIKEKMLYSSCKQPFLMSAAESANLKPDIKIETDSKEVLTYDVLMQHVHPPVGLRDPGFAKPPGPHHRGSRRIIKAGL
ncbi:unnamed protein product [Enterobius vermicularis]|uniref:ADF-H domain-containing protein n=1 Tax=Enterobius vermicularis TaxID=51028 RepID=A0A0N4V6I6_ENTVE|nr:unnamed protein product [Enterobius vermicularis]